MRLLRTLTPTAALVLAAALHAQTPPPAGPTTGGTTPPPKAPGAGGTTPAPKAPGAGGPAPTGPKLIFPGDIGRDRTTATSNFPVALYRTPDVARSLSISEAQAARLNTATDQLQTRYREQFDRLATLPERERADRTLQLNREYTAAWLAGAKGILDERQLARYQQLQLQFGGFGSLTDPAVQRQLALTEAQVGRLPDTLNWSDLQMQAILRQAELDRARGLQMFSDYYRAYQERMNEFLTAEQLRQWREMTGEPFQFPPPFPATGGPGGPTTGGTVPPAGPTTGGPVPPKR